MLETTLPKAIPLGVQMQSELPVIKIRRPEEKKAEDLVCRTIPPEANFAQLHSVLQNLAKSVEQAQNYAQRAGQVQQECFERAQVAESEKTRLQQEVLFLQARIQELEARVPRWVRKLCGVSFPTK